MCHTGHKNLQGGTARSNEFPTYYVVEWRVPRSMPRGHGPRQARQHNTASQQPAQACMASQPASLTKETRSSKIEIAPPHRRRISTSPQTERNHARTKRGHSRPCGGTNAAQGPEEDLHRLFDQLSRSGKFHRFGSARTTPPAFLDIGGTFVLDFTGVNVHDQRI